MNIDISIYMIYIINTCNDTTDIGDTMSFRIALAISTIFGLMVCFLIICIGFALQMAGMSKINFVKDTIDILT